MKNYHLHLTWFIITTMAVLPVQSQFRKVATTGYGFLEIPVTARMAAMGETSVALVDAGIEAMFFNPALVAYAPRRHHLTAAYANYLADIQHQALGYGMQLTPIGAFGLSVNRFDLGEMVETVNADANNPGGRYLVKGRYRADALAVGLTYAHQATAWFAFGITAKYVRERISIYDSDNLLLDLGMVYRTQFQSLRLGGYIQNFGVDSKYVGDTFKMPMIFRLGLALEIFGNLAAPNRLTLALEALHPSDYTERLHLGGECWLQNLVALRFGYKFNYDEEGLTAGIGLKWQANQKIIGIDLAYTDYGRLDSVVRLTTSAGF